MTSGERTLRKLALAGLLGAALVAAGALLVWGAAQQLAAERRALDEARLARSQTQERLMRIADEEREVKEKLEVYRRLAALGILGEERRLDWVDALARIRASRELPELRYRIERRSALGVTPGSPGSVESYASTLKLEAGLLHEGDLLRVLADLREAGKAYHAVKHCRIERVALPPAGSGIAPRLRAQCEIDLVTLIDRAAKL